MSEYEEYKKHIKAIATDLWCALLLAPVFAFMAWGFFHQLAEYGW